MPSEHDGQMNGKGIDFEDGYAFLASFQKNAGHASRHVHHLIKIRSNPNTMQAAYHPAGKNFAHNRKELSCIAMHYSYSVHLTSGRDFHLAEKFSLPNR
jgi:hypothetical protein